MILGDTSEPVPPRHRKMLEEVAKSSARLVGQVDELSLIGKLDAGDVKLARQPLDVGALIHDVAEHVHEATDRDVHLVLQGDPGPALMTGDLARLRGAFDAVFRAILREKAGPATVAADRRRDTIDGQVCAVVVVADASAVQESYARPRGVFNDKRGGLGLALPLARRVFEGHGGSIWSPAPAPGVDPEKDPLSRSSAIIALPITEHRE
jgi:signal transduction histidine kinase